MGRRLLLGTLAGFVPAQLSWIANDSDQAVSVLPDAMTLIVLFALIYWAIRLDVRRGQITDRGQIWMAGAMVSMASGSVFATGTVLIGVSRLNEPILALGAYGFVTAFLVAVGCGTVASALMLRAAQRQADASRIPDVDE